MIITRDMFYPQRITPRDNRFFAAQHPWVSLVTCDLEPLAHQGIPMVLPADADALPVALITPSEEDPPFGAHTPRLWQYYPFTLTAHVVGLDANDSGKLGTVLQGDPCAPHWHDHIGYRLFDDDGQASQFLQKTLTGLRAVQQEVMKTQQLVWQLHQWRVLTPCHVQHEGQWLTIYRIDLTALEAHIGNSEDPQAAKLLMMATTLEQSQKDLNCKVQMSVAAEYGHSITSA
nr:SapC family protein [uncultured Halomonas sp.]